MVKRTSRENAKDRKASEDLSDDSAVGPPNKRRKYDLRKKKNSGTAPPPVQDKKKNKKEEKEEILWIDDDTLSSSDGSSCYSEEEQGLSLNIHIHTAPKEEPDSVLEKKSSIKSKGPSRANSRIEEMLKKANSLQRK